MNSEDQYDSTYGKCEGASDNGRKLADAPKATSSSSGNEHKAGKFLKGLYSSMNALIESYKFDVSMSAGDDVGMNLLASVATGEMSKSNMASPNYSP